MERNFRKKVGRYLKKDDPVLGVVSLKKFSFEVICDFPIVEYDNPGNNLIYSRYHDPDELSGVREHSTFNEEVRDSDMIPDVLAPIDFTRDWRRQQERASKRSKGKPDEEDDYDLEVELTIQQQLSRNKSHKEKENEIDMPQAAQTTAEAKASDADEGNKAKDAPETETSGSSTSTRGNAKTPSTDQTDIKGYQSQQKGLAEVGHAINEINTHGDAPIEPALNLKKENKASKLESPGNQTQSVQPTPANQVQTPEADAMREYREVLSNPELSPKNLKEQIEASKAQGYQDGFKQGEEKATLHLLEISKRVIESAEGMINELSAARSKILTEAQGNFLEVCQALAQSLLGKELRIDPQAFAELITRAVKDTISDDQFRVGVHPEFYQILSKSDLKDLSGRFFQDANIMPGDFRIESKQAVIDGNLKQMIDKLLEQADLNIIDDDSEKAG